MFPSAKSISDERTDTGNNVCISDPVVNSKNEELDWLSLGSFKSELIEHQEIPRNYAVDEAERPSSESPVQEHHKKKKKEKHKHKKKKKKSRARSADKDNIVEQPQKEVIFKGNKVFIEEIPGLEFKDAYRVDRKSDINTWNYGSLYKGHVARYHDNLKDCIGTTSQVVAMKENMGKKHKKSDFSRYCSKDSRKNVHSIPTHKIIPSGDTLLDDLSVEKREVISLGEPVVSDRSVDIRDRLMDSATALYIQGKGTDTLSDKTEMSEESAIVHQTVAEYNRKTRENPHDIDMWLKFVDFQDKLASEEFSDRKLTENSILEKKISIIKKAIEANPGNIELKIKHLDLCKETMSPELVTKEMEQLLFLHPTNMLLWKQYLFYHQSCVSIFTVSRVCKVYQKCFSKMIGYLEGRLYTHSLSDNLHSQVLDVFVQYCYFLKQVGQMEKAIASFQALIEFNLYCPEALENIKHEEKMVIFESFWDSGVPRVGEDGAKGWSFWYSNRELKPEAQTVHSKNLEDIEQEIIKNENIKWKLWMTLELERQTAHWFPWRPDISQNETEEDCEDLDRLVIFDDINNVLVPVPLSAHFDLVTYFLKFLGIEFENDSNWWPSSLENLQNVVKHAEIDITKNYLTQSEIQQDFIKCLIDKMIEKFNNEEKTSLILYKMNFNYDLCKNESKKFSKFKKFAKTLLSEVHSRNNLLVWGAYCGLLWKSGLEKEAKSVIETALSMVNDKTQKYGCFKLYRMLTELHLGMNFEENNKPSSCDLSEAQNVLICLTEGKSNVKVRVDLTSTTILRCRKYLESLCDTSIEDMSNIEKLKTLSKHDLGYICETFKLYALFEYSFGKNELELAITVLEDAVKHIKEFLQENDIKTLSIKVNHVMKNLLCYSVRLVKHHMSAETAPLSFLRNILHHALKIFPDNNYFLQVFVEMELRTYTSGRLDRYFSHMIQSADSPIPVIFAVYSILCRQISIDRQLQCQDMTTVISKGGMINRIHSYLEKALSNSSVCHCPLIWRLYLHSEVQFDNLSRAKGIFYRALQSCPWSKAIYLDAVNLFSGDTVEEIVDLMTEKEIRVQIPLEEVDILTDGKQDSTEDNDDS